MMRAKPWHTPEWNLTLLIQESNLATLLSSLKRRIITLANEIKHWQERVS